MFPRRVSSSAVVGVVVGGARTYGYQPPGGVAGERRLPWQLSQSQRTSAQGSNTPSCTSTVPSSHTDSSPLLSHVLNASPQRAPMTTTVETHAPPTVSAAARPLPSQKTAAHARHSLPEDSTVNATAQARVSSAASTSASSVAVSGGLRNTNTLRMPVLPGPTLDTRIEDIVKTEESVASEPLPKVVQLLIDPDATNVERITMADFVAMQPKRQLMALGGKKSWLEWLQNSPYYQQVSRLSTDSPAHDLRALHQAGLHTLYQWAEQPNLVQVSPRTRSALNAAVQHSVTAFMEEVARVVNTSTHHKRLLDCWLADVVGAFVLDSLNIRVEAASAAMWEQRGNGLMPSDVRASREATAEGGTRAGALNDSGESMMSLLLGDDVPPSSRARRKHSSAASATPSVLPPGECCTLEHYARFVQKVVVSVRKEAEKRAGVAGAASSSSSGSGAGNGSRGAARVLMRDAQSEMEIVERSNALIATALTQLLEQAAQKSLPEELNTLHQGGYLALGRVPELLKGALSMLAVRDVPVRYFVFHSTIDSDSPQGGGGGRHAARRHGDGGPVDPLMVPTASFAPGVFLTGTEHVDVTLKDWTGAADASAGSSSGGVGASATTAATASAHTHRPQQQDDPVVAEYLSVLHRLRRHVMRLSSTSLLEIMQAPEQFGGYGFNASEALGMDQLFGTAKLVEDRLASVLSYPAATVRKPLHVLEAGYTSGKTAVLERLAAHRTRPGERAVLVRYKSSSTPFVPDLDDHPIAFPSRFWFRVALATCPYFIHTEELFSRAPRSVMWWGNERNWTWSSYQRLILSPSSSASSASSSAAGAVKGSTEKLAAVLVDDFDVVLDAMEAKWSDDVDGDSEMSLLNAPVSLARTHLHNHHHNGSSHTARLDDGDEAPTEEDVNWIDNSPEVGDEDAAVEGRHGTRDGASAAMTAVANPEADLAAAMTVEQRRLARARWTAATGKPFQDVLTSCFGKLTIALGQVNLIVASHHVSRLLLTHSNGVPCQRYFIPLSSGVGLQQRLRVLPLMSTLYAFHLYNGLEFSGVLYEVLKNAPALAGKVLEIFWTGRIHALNLRMGAVHSLGGARLDGAMPLLRGYALPELFEGLPERNYLFAHPRRERTRLVQLLQRQVCSNTGFLGTGIDTTRRDDRDGIILPHHNTSSQVNPFALFLVFSRLEELEGLGAAAADGTAAGSSSSARGGAASAPSAALAGAREKRIVRAWAEVWTQYAYVVGMMATIPERKREAMRVLLQGVLLLRAASVAGVELALNLKVPAYGFPLLATDTGARHGGHDAHHSSGGNGGTGAPSLSTGSAGSVTSSTSHPLSAQTVGKAVSAYRSFFASATQSHFSFVPLPGRNGGCDLVMLAGASIYFYDVVTTVEERSAITLRFAETLLGMLHSLEKQVLPADKVRQLHYITVVSIDHHSTRVAQAGSVASQDLARNSTAALASVAPYYMDLGRLFDDTVLDHLRRLQEPLGLAKKAFRTLNDLIDELARAFHVRVRHDFRATQEELESLFTPTLLQLVPDATILPPYQSPIVTAEDLMRKAMFEASGVDVDGDDATEDALILDAGDDDMVHGAEMEDVHSDAMLARDGEASAQLQRDVLGADNEALHESAALLEMMLNDELDLLTGAAERQKMATAATATDLHNDFAIENSLNYRVDSVSATGSSGMLPSTATPSAAGGVASAHSSHNGAAAVTPRATHSGEDSLAWLHDILSPDTLTNGLRPGASTAVSSGAGGGAASAATDAASSSSRFSNLVEAATSTFGLPTQPTFDNWLHAGANNSNNVAAANELASRAAGDGDEEADAGELDLDLGVEDADKGAADGAAASTPGTRKRSGTRSRAGAGAGGRAKSKAGGRGAGRGQRGRGGNANETEGEVVTLEDLLIQVGRRNAAAHRSRAAKQKKSSSAAASASRKKTSAGKSAGSAASAKKKIKAAAASSKARKSSPVKSSGTAQTNKKKNNGNAARRRSGK